MPESAAGGSRQRSPRAGASRAYAVLRLARALGGRGLRFARALGSRAASPSAVAPSEPAAPRGAGAIRWSLIPLAMGAVLAAALLAEALVTGARDSVVRTSALLGAGDLTIQPEGAVDGAPAEPALLESGAVFSNPALMRVPGRVVARVELRGFAAAGTLKQAVHLAGLDGPSDPQAVLLSRFLVQGRWPEAEPLGGPGRHGVVLGATLSGRLGLGAGDAIQIGAGDAPAEPFAPRASAQVGPLAPRASARGGPFTPRDGVVSPRASARLARSWQGRVAGVLRTGLPELDAGRVWTGLASAQELLPVPARQRAEAATRIAVYLDRPAEAAEWMSAVSRLTLPEGAEVLTWRQVNPDALPWGPWQRVQSRTGWMAFAGVALAAAAGGIAAGLIGRYRATRASRPAPGTELQAPRTETSAPHASARHWAGLAWRLVGPGLLGLTLAAAIYAACWAALRAAPVPAAAVFSRLGAELNPFGELTASVAPRLGVSRALELCLTAAGVYGAAAALCLGWRGGNALEGKVSKYRG